MSDPRSVLVTGGANGLGAAIARRLARDGRDVFIADIDDAGAAALVAEIAETGATAAAVRADVTSSTEVDAAVERACRDARLDTLVCAAAIESRAPLAETGDDAWQRIIDVDLKGPFLAMKHAIPRMAEAGGGSVILLGSTLGHLGQPGYAAYCAAKGALVNLAKQAAIEHAADRVRVNVVSPSACDTGLFMEMVRRAPDPDAIIEMVTSNNPMQRLGSSSEVAGTVAFLASDDAAYISGTTIPVDGGLAARRLT